MWQRKWAGEDAGWFRRHSLSIVLITLLLAQMVIYHFALVPEWTAEQAAHGESTALWPAYWQHYIAEWHVSVLADTYGALLLVVLTKWFYEAGSAETNG